MRQTFRVFTVTLMLVFSFLACSKKQESSSSTTTTTTTTAPAAPAAPSAPAVAPAPAAPAAPAPTTAGAATPVEAVKNFFDSVYNQKYDVSWSILSTPSQNKIAQMVADEEKLDMAKVKGMFDANDKALQLGFWNAFRESSKVTTFVPNATYELVNDGGTIATVKLKSGTVEIENKAIKEGNGWRMGYVETFMADEMNK